MSDRPRVLVSWSSGKDSAWMLHHLQQDSDLEVAGLLTTFNEAADRVAMHGVRRSLVQRQATAVGLPLTSVMLPWPCSNEHYESRMRVALDKAQRNGITHVAFGDLYLEDIRDYRIRQLADTALEPLFPIWCGRQGTQTLIRQMLDTGFRTLITCLDPQRVPRELIGRELTEEFLAELPDTVDPCGENGEFHTLCWSGPHQDEAIPVEVGDIVERDGFLFADVVADDGRVSSA